ncbi:agglutinin biogenesis protein MshP [Massilia sp. ST3]|uniref:agglutinin biogenesis protein MshP n=1 Tax=Massilia sp. ST3 TaxID=2824903 RepID=UPI001B83B848|nr:agglutinin biogenesis protein MshP [Massilia sp. ST3]MBQ5947592.1 agglutinin biogenesis protein MshP [Massilia sp. ST3]
MNRYHLSVRRLARSAGVGLVTAIFLLVVLAGMGVAAVSLFNSQQASASLDLEGARAYQAARAGIEWGLFQRLRAGQCAAPTSFRLPDSVLASYTVTVSCTLLPTLQVEDDNGDPQPLQRWRIRAIACNQPVNGACEQQPSSTSPDYVRRQVEVEL